MSSGRSAAQAWRALGASEPYFAVLTDERYLTADRPGPSREAFFRTGEDDIARLFEQIGAAYPSFAPRRALDFGCGVGRLVLPLARRAAEVVGVDVSAAMIEEARRNVAEAGLQNVELHVSDSPGWRAHSYDLVHSSIVFQHIPQAEGLRIVREITDRLMPGGIGALHFIYGVRRPLWWRLAYWCRRNVPGAHRVANAIRGHRVDRPLMQMNAYPLATLYELIHDSGAQQIQSILTDHDGFLGALLIFRKPDRG